jgi:uncharacterized protein (TIGR00251 family)
MPRAPKDRFGEVLGTQLKIHITAAPTNGKANKHLKKFLAEQFRVPQSHIELLSGKNQQNKKIKIISPERCPGLFSYRNSI